MGTRGMWAVLCPQHCCGRNCFSSGVSAGNLHTPYSIITKGLTLLPIATPVLPLGINAEPLACALVTLCSSEHSFKYVVRCSSKSLSAVQCRGRMFLQTSIHNSVLWLLSTLFWLLQTEQITRLHKVSSSLLSNFSFLVFTLFTACSALSLKELPA